MKPAFFYGDPSASGTRSPSLSRSFASGKRWATKSQSAMLGIFINHQVLWTRSPKACPRCLHREKGAKQAVSKWAAFFYAIKSMDEKAQCLSRIQLRERGRQIQSQWVGFFLYQSVCGWSPGLPDLASEKRTKSHQQWLDFYKTISPMDEKTQCPCPTFHNREREQHPNQQWLVFMTNHQPWNGREV